MTNHKIFLCKLSKQFCCWSGLFALKKSPENEYCVFHKFFQWVRCEIKKWFSSLKNKFSTQCCQFFGKSRKYFGNILNMTKDLPKIGGNQNKFLHHTKKWQFDTFTHFLKFFTNSRNRKRRFAGKPFANHIGIFTPVT